MVCFHLLTEPNAYLSNWYPSRFKVDGIACCCVEQYLMHQKALAFGDERRARMVLKTEEPEEMQRIGREVEGYDDDVWAGMRQLVAYRALKAKFSQNPLLGERLVATGDAVIAECARRDRVWGTGLGMDDERRFAISQWPGKNLLGFTLMIVREELRGSLADVEAEMQQLHAIASRLADAARTHGERGIIAAISGEEMRSLGLVMDCGQSFERMYGQALGDAKKLEQELQSIDDPFVLGSAIFSEWRYCTHWAMEPMGDERVRWFELAAKRLGELTRG